MKTHRPLLGIAIAFSFGIILGKYIHWPFWILCALTFFILLSNLLFLKRNKLGRIIIFSSFILLGSVASSHYQYMPANHIFHVARYYKKNPVLIEGVVISDVQKRKFIKSTKTIFKLKVKRFKTKWGWKEKSGIVLVQAFRNVNISYGDRILLQGKMYVPFNFTGNPKFSYRNYLNNKGIKLIVSIKKDGTIEMIQSNCANPIQATSIRLKNRLNEVFSQYLSPIETGLMQALILGDRYDIPKHIMDLFVQTGTAHILAISGFNVGIVAFLVLLILKILPLKQRTQYLITIIFLIGYAFLTGSKPPVVRSTIMAVVFLSSFLVEREVDSLNSLSLAALIILILNPLDLFDIGFQLSFMSVLTIILFYAHIFHWFEQLGIDFKNKIFLFLAQSLALSLSAWAGVVGLLVYYFDIITPVTILANLIVIPLISFVVILGLGLLAVGLVLPSFSFIFASMIKMTLNITVGCIYLFSQIPGAYFYIPHSPLYWLISYYLLLAAIVTAIYLCALTKKLKCDTLNHMKKILLLTGAFLLICSSQSFAFWMWTPETNRWINPKYDVKETPDAQFKFAKGFYDAKDYKKGINEFEKLIRSYPKSKEAPEAQYFIGFSLADQEKYYEAFKAYQKVIDKYPFSDRFAEVVEKQYQIGELLMEGRGKNKKSKLITTIIGGEYDVIDIFRTVIKNAPYGKYAAPSQYKIGLYLAQKELYQEARDEFEKVINDYPASDWVKGARYQIAMVDAKRSTKPAYDQKITKAAVDEFKEFTKTYPDAELSQQAQQHISGLREKEAENNFLIARFYEKQKDFISAEIYYETVMNDYKDTAWAPKAAVGLRDLALRKQKKK